MPKITIAIAVLMILLGISGYFGTGQASPTALIPSFFGVAMLILGLLALRDRLRKHAIYAIAAFSFLGFLGTARGLVNYFFMLGGGEVERPAAVPFQAAMAVLCAILIGLSIWFFVRARRPGAQQSNTDSDATPPSA